MGKVIGIDLEHHRLVRGRHGATSPRSSADAEMAPRPPSAFARTSERLVGLVARRRAGDQPTNTLSHPKRFMGRRYDRSDVEMKLVPSVVRGANNDARVKSGDGECSRRPKDRHRDDPAEDEGHRRGTSAKVTKPSSPCRPTSTTRSAGHERTPVASRGPRREAHRQRARPPRSPGLDKKKDEKVAVFDLTAAVRSTSRSSGSATACSKCALDERRHAPRRRRLRPEDHRLARGRVPRAGRASTCARTRWRSVKETAERPVRAVGHHADGSICRSSPPNSVGPEAPRHLAHARQARADRRRSSVRCREPLHARRS